MTRCDTCKNTDGAECIGCKGWLAASATPRRLLEVPPAFACACGDVEREGWVHRRDYCWPYDEHAAPLPPSAHEVQEVGRG